MQSLYSKAMSPWGKPKELNKFSMLVRISNIGQGCSCYWSSSSGWGCSIYQTSGWWNSRRGGFAYRCGFCRSVPWWHTVSYVPFLLSDFEHKKSRKSVYGFPAQCFYCEDRDYLDVIYSIKFKMCIRDSAGTVP